MPHSFIPTASLFLSICFKLLVLLFIIMFMNTSVLKLRPTLAFNRKKKKSFLTEKKFLTAFNRLTSVTGDSVSDDLDPSIHLCRCFFLRNFVFRPGFSMNTN